MIVLQEVRRNSSAMEQLIAAINQYQDRWGYMYSEMGHLRRDDEQAAIVFDIRRIRPAGFQGPISASSLDLEKYAFNDSLYVAPFVHSFEMRGVSFSLLRVLFNYLNIDDYRKSFVPNVAEILKRVQKWASEEKAAGRSLITIGDFADREEQVTKLIRKSRLAPPPELENIIDIVADDTALYRVPFYDQIAWFSDSEGKPVLSFHYKNTAGAFDFTKYMFPDLPVNQMTWRISDHVPLWVEFSTLNTRSDDEISRDTDE